MERRRRGGRGSGYGEVSMALKVMLKVFFNIPELNSPKSVLPVDSSISMNGNSTLLVA